MSYNYAENYTNKYNGLFSPPISPLPLLDPFAPGTAEIARANINMLITPPHQRIRGISTTFSGGSSPNSSSCYGCYQGSSGEKTWGGLGTPF